MVRRLMTVGFLVALAFFASTPAAAVENTPDTGINSCYDTTYIVQSAPLVTRYYSPACNRYFGRGWAWHSDPVTVWMEDNPSATIVTGDDGVYSGTWWNGRACVSHSTIEQCA